MNVAAIIRDYLNQIGSFFYITKNLFKINIFSTSIDVLQSFYFFIDILISIPLTKFQQIIDLIELSIFLPILQFTESKSNIFLITPFIKNSVVPTNLNLLVIIIQHFSIYAFQHRFLKSFFLVSPANLVLILNIRRYWLYGF